MAWSKIDDWQDPRVSPYREIAHRPHAGHGDSFVVEGRWMVERLLVSPFQTRSLIVAENRVDQWTGRVPPSVPVYVMEPDEMKQLLGYNFHRGVLACGVRNVQKRLNLPPMHPTQTALVVACPRVVNPENLGSIIRSAAAFGAIAVMCGQDCADPFSRRVIRVSAGNVFRIPIIQPDDLEEELIRLRSKSEFCWLATGLDDGKKATSLANFQPLRRSILLLGAEDFGLESRWIEQADHCLTIPMSLDTDSLNVAVAAAVMLYALTQGNPALDSSSP